MAKVKALTLSLLLLSVGVGASAAPSLLGASGGLVIPDAEVLPEGTASVGSSLTWVDRAGKTVNNEWHAVTLGTSSNLEVGIARVVNRTPVAKETLVQGKFQLLREADRLPALAVGALDLSNALDLSEATAFLAASKTVWATEDEFTGERVQPLRATVGFGTGLYGNSPFAGLDWQVHPRARVLFEYSKFKTLDVADDYLFNLGAQLRIGSSVLVGASLVDMQYPSLQVSLLSGRLW